MNINYKINERPFTMRNLDYDLIPQSFDIRSLATNSEIGIVVEYIISGIYKIPERNNTIKIESLISDESDIKELLRDNDKNEKEICLAVLFDKMMDPHYSYLMNVLNTMYNVAVEVSAVPYTTSDFIIYYDNKFPEDMNNIDRSFKYLEYKNDEFNRVIL